MMIPLYSSLFVVVFFFCWLLISKLFFAFALHKFQSQEQSPFSIISVFAAITSLKYCVVFYSWLSCLCDAAVSHHLSHAHDSRYERYRLIGSLCSCWFCSRGVKSFGGGGASTRNRLSRLLPIILAASPLPATKSFDPSRTKPPVT